MKRWERHAALRRPDRVIDRTSHKRGRLLAGAFAVAVLLGLAVML
jgi:hypothetical protein